MSDVLISRHNMMKIISEAKTIMNSMHPKIQISEEELRSVTWGILSLLRKISPRFDQDLSDWMHLSPSHKEESE